MAYRNQNDDSGNDALVSTAVSVVIALLVLGVVLTPIISAFTTEKIGHYEEYINENPIGDLRLSYYSDDIPEKTFTFAVSGATANVTGDWEGTIDLSISQIIVGSDVYSLIVRDGVLIECADGGYSQISDSLTVSVTGGEINGTACSFVYLPDTEGTYANYSSYDYAIQPMFSVGSFAGTSVTSVDGTVVGSNPYGFSADVQTEGDTVTGVDYVVDSQAEEP